jgi:hypothetical protein
MSTSRIGLWSDGRILIINPLAIAEIAHPSQKSGNWITCHDMTGCSNNDWLTST